jgi:hypothetical protein
MALDSVAAHIPSTATLMKKNLDEFSKDGFEMHWGCFEQYTGTPSTHEWIKL